MNAPPIPTDRRNTHARMLPRPLWMPPETRQLELRLKAWRPKHDMRKN